MNRASSFGWKCHLRRLAAATVWPFVLGGSVLPGCALPDPTCTPDTWRCNGDELQSCTPHGGGFYGGNGSVHHVSSSSPTWE